MGSIGVTSNSALLSGIEGFKAASEKLSGSTTLIADFASEQESSGHSARLHSAAAALISGSLQATASAEIINSAKDQGEILGSIIDTFV